MAGLFKGLVGLGRNSKSISHDKQPSRITPGDNKKTDAPKESKPRPFDGSAASPTPMNRSDSAFDFIPKAPPNRSTYQNQSNDRSDPMRLSKSNPVKQDDDFNIPSDTVIPNFASSGIGKTTSEVRTAPPAAVIGAKITFRGELSGEEDLLVEGKIEGTIELRNHHLTIGKQGSIKANVIAKSITVEGSVEGDLVAPERIGIKASSNVTGNVAAERVTLEEGARFRGSIDMETKSVASTSSKYTPTADSQPVKVSG